MNNRRPHISGILLTVCLGLFTCLNAHAAKVAYGTWTDTAKVAPPFIDDEEAIDVELAPDDSLDIVPFSDASSKKELRAAKKKRRQKLLLESSDSLKSSADTTRHKRQKRDWSTWRPDPKRAMWLAVVIPGAGQIYNQKFWKLPIIYGGFVGCAYAMRWNNQMYHDYSQAYLDLMDDDPNTQSYNQFLHLGGRIDKSNEEQWKKIFKRRKDYYRRYRDMSFFIMVGVYAVSIIDAYVDASLAQFDISDDLSLKVEPTVINNGNILSLNSIRSSALGLQCSINF